MKKSNKTIIILFFILQPCKATRGNDTNKISFGLNRVIRVSESIIQVKVPLSTVPFSNYIQGIFINNNVIKVNFILNFEKALPSIIVKLTAAFLLDETLNALTCIQATIGSEMVPSSTRIVLLESFTCGLGSEKKRDRKFKRKFSIQL